jgi:Histidyl-tRNA synthetase
MTGDENPAGRRCAGFSALAADPRSAVPVRLAASQRVVRAQHFAGPGMLAHFQIFALITAGRDTGSQIFEHQHLAEHLHSAIRAMATAGVRQTEIRITDLDESAAPVLARLRTALAHTPEADLIDDPDRATGRGYYTGLCYKVYATVAGQRLEIADGGFVDWTQRLTGNRKERLLIGGFGLDRLAGALTPPAGEGPSPQR